MRIAGLCFAMTTTALIRASGRPVTVFGEGVARLPQTLCFGIAGISAETLVIALDLAGIAVSSGSACSSGKVAPSHVLAAMGVDPALAHSAIRISLGWESTKSDLDLFARAWRERAKAHRAGRDSGGLTPQLGPRSLKPLWME